MAKPYLSVIVYFFSFLFFISCHTENNSSNEGIATDSLSIASGQHVFTANCSGCHNFSNDGIGPRLGGVTQSTPVDWLKNFIKNPQKFIYSEDPKGKALYVKYKTAMPSFASLTDNDIDNIVSFLNTHKEKSPMESDDDKGGIANPIVDPIPLSNLQVSLKLIAQMPSSSSDGKSPLARITKMEAQPGTDDLFVVDLRGKLYKIQNNKPIVYLDLKKMLPHFVDEPGLATGFGSFAFHPDFLKNGLLFTTHTEPPATAKADFGYGDAAKVTLQWVLTEWKADDPKAPFFSGKWQELLRVDVVSGIHGVQDIAFDPNVRRSDKDYGKLYIGVGDGGCVENGYAFLAHSRQKVWGTILRIDPLGKNSSNGKYGIPHDNPFANDRDQKTVKEIYAYGFRNPHRFSWTTHNDMLACNIGQSNIESIDLIHPGCDYGWPEREGDFVVHPHGNLARVYALPAEDSANHFTYPVAEFDHDEGKAICGGFEYSLNTIAALKGKYLFGDIPGGRLFFLELKEISKTRLAPISEWRIKYNGEITNLKKLCGSDRVDLHFARDARGNLYILTKADGRIYQLIGAKQR